MSRDVRFYRRSMHRAAALAVLSVLTLESQVSAKDYHWNNPNGGNWVVSSNWTAPAPVLWPTNLVDNVDFTLNAALDNRYTVDMQSYATSINRIWTGNDSARLVVHNLTSPRPEASILRSASAPTTGTPISSSQAPPTAARRAG